MSTLALGFEKETLRNLAGPELFQQTVLEPLAPAGLEGVNGGSLLGGMVSAIGSAINSALAGASLAAPITTFVSSGVVSGVVSAVASAHWGFEELN